jgi:ABC-type amino acid transport substrate-binding protein
MIAWQPWARMAGLALAVFVIASPAFAQKPKAAKPAAAPATTIDRIRAGARIRLGYRADARPFSFATPAGDPDGYSVGLCLNVANALKADLGIPALVVEWVPVTLENRFQLVQQGQVDLLCGADTRTLARMQEVAFSTSTFPGGIGALVRRDASTRLTDVLSGKKPASQPNWRASSIQLLQTQNFAVIAGTTAETWVNGKKQEFKLTSKVVPVDGYDAGVQAVLDRKASVFFGDRSILLDAAKRNPAAGKLMVLERMFTNEPMALVFARGNDDFRAAVDRALSRLYAAGEFTDLYTMWFGTPDAGTLAYFKWNTVPE